MVYDTKPHDEGGGVQMEIFEIVVIPFKKVVIRRLAPYMGQKIVVMIFKNVNSGHTPFDRV